MTGGWTWRTCPGWLCTAGWRGLAPAVNILLIDLRWFGQGSFVAPSPPWELVLLQEQFSAEPKCYPSPSTASRDTEGCTVLQLPNRLKRENYFVCHL